MPCTLRPVDVGDEALAELDVLVGFDDDLAGEATRSSHPAVLEILSRCGGPAGIAKAGRRKLVAAIMTALEEKTVLQQRKQVAIEVEGKLDAHLLAGA